MPSDLVTITGFVAAGAVGIAAPVVAARNGAREARRDELRDVLDAAASQLARARHSTERLDTLWRRSVAPGETSVQEAVDFRRAQVADVRHGRDRLAIRLGLSAPATTSYIDVLGALDQYSIPLMRYARGQGGRYVAAEQTRLRRAVRDAHNRFLLEANRLVRSPVPSPLYPGLPLPEGRDA